MNRSSNKRKGLTLSGFALCILVCGLLTILFFIIDYFDGTYVRRVVLTLPAPPTNPITWAPIASPCISFNLISAYILKHYVGRHGRNVVRWTTAFVVFSPLLAGIAYLLTWPKNQRQKGD